MTEFGMGIYLFLNFVAYVFLGVVFSLFYNDGKIRFIVVLTWPALLLFLVILFIVSYQFNPKTKKIEQSEDED